jgi:uncharacterized protein involved in outer membrane biogenesis
MKTPYKILIAAAAVLAVLFGASAAFLAWKFPPAKVKALVLEQAKAKLGREVGIDGAGLKFWPFLGVSLKGVEVANNPDSGFSKEPMLHVDEIGVELSVRSLFDMAPVVNEIRVIGPRIRMEVLPDGRTSLDGLGGPKDTTIPVKTDSVKPLELPFPLTVRRILVKSGSFAWIDRSKGQELTVGEIDQTVSLSTDKALENVESQGQLDIREIGISGSGVPVRKGGIHVSVTHDLSLNLPKASVEIRSVKAGVQDVSVELKGKAGNLLVTPDIDIEAKSGNISLASLLKEVPKGLNAWVDKATLAGSVDFDIKAKGKLKPGRIPAVDGTVHLVGIGASVAGIPAKLEGLSGTIAIFPTDSLLGVKIDPMDMKVAGNPIDVKLEAIDLPNHPFLRSLDSRGKLDLAAVSALVPGLDTFALAGAVEFDVKGQGPLDPARPTALQLAGSSKLDKVGAKAPGLPDRVNVDGTASFANTELGAKLSIVTGPTDLSVDAKVTDWMAMVLPKLAAGKVTSVTAAVKSRQIDLDRILPPPDTTKKTEPSAPLAIPKLPNVKASATVDVALVKAFGMQLTALKSATTVNNGVVTMRNSAGVYGGTFGQTLDANLANPKSVSLRTAVDVKAVEASLLFPAVRARVPSASLRSLADGLSGKGNVSVKASLDGDPAQLQKLLNADIAASFANGKLSLPLFGKMTGSVHSFYSAVPDLKSIDFTSFKLAAHLKDGNLQVDDLSMDGNAVGSIQAKGTIGLDQSLAMTSDVHLPKAASAPILAGGAAASGYLKGVGLDASVAPPTDKDKRVIVSYLIGGTLSNPTFKADTPRMGSLVKGAAGAVLSQKKQEAEAAVARQKTAVTNQANAAVKKTQDAAKTQVNTATQKATTTAKNAIGKQLKGFGL